MTARAQTGPSCSDLASLKIDGVEITSSTEAPANAPTPPSYPRYSGSLPAHCRVEGVIHRRKGVDGIEYGIGFAVAWPEKDVWNGDFMMQGGGGGQWRGELSRWSVVYGRKIGSRARIRGGQHGHRT
jgi:feruloyl esterase